MFVDQITLTAYAGNGGDGVVRWRHEKFKPKAGPAGGNGGRGGDVYVRAVRDISLLAKYSGAKTFHAEHGESGAKDSRDGKNGADLYIDVPVGSRVTDVARNRTYELLSPDQTALVYRGGAGGYGNESFKSATNRAPMEATLGKPGEGGELFVELSLLVDVGLIGQPNAGKSTLLNTLTNAKSRIGAYPFTTLQPQLGDFYSYVIADIPGLIAGASAGKGLGHTFLRHITRTNLLLHLVSLADPDPLEQYYAIRRELSEYGKQLTEREEWIVFTKKDVANKEALKDAMDFIDNNENRSFVLSAETGEGVPELQRALVEQLQHT